MGNSHCCHGKVSPYTVERSAARAKEVEDKDEGMFHLGLVACNEKGEIMNCNKHMEYVTGFPKSEMVGQSVNIMLPKEFHERHNQYIQNHVSKDLGPKKDAGGIRFIAAISKASKADKKLFGDDGRRDSLAMAAGTGGKEKKADDDDDEDGGLADTSVTKKRQLAIMVANGEGHLVACNPFASELTFYSQSELLHGSLDLVLPPSVRSAHRSWVQDYIRRSDEGEKPEETSPLIDVPRLMAFTTRSGREVGGLFNLFDMGKQESNKVARFIMCFRLAPRGWKKSRSLKHVSSRPNSASSSRTADASDVQAVTTKSFRPGTGGKDSKLEAKD